MGQILPLKLEPPVTGALRMGLKRFVGKHTPALSLCLGGTWLMTGSTTETCLALAFLLLVVVPTALLAKSLVARMRLTEALQWPVACGLTFGVLPFLYLLRCALPCATALGDAILCTLLWACAAGLRCHQTWDSNHSSDKAANDSTWTVAVVLTLFLSSRLFWVNESAGIARFFGPALMDFGDLRMVVNLVSLSGGHVPAPVEGCGTLVYHWLFFAIPAWMGHYFGFKMDTGVALTLTTLGAAFLFFTSLIYACRSITKVEQKHLAPLGALAGIACTSIYHLTHPAYVAVLHALNITVPARNDLVLQLPTSISIFGNNTLALAMVVMAVLLLGEWNNSRRLPALLASATMVAFVPAFSITLSPAVAIGIGGACFTGAVRSRWLALAAFAIAGLGMCLEVAGLDYFTGTHYQVSFAFDGGLFLKTILLSFPLAVAALGWAASQKKKHPLVPLFLWLAIGSVISPSFLSIEGEPFEPSAMSMKNSALFLACACPLVWLAALEWRNHPSRKLLSRRNLVALAAGLGLLCSSAHLLATPLSRLGIPMLSSVTLTSDHLAALRHVRDSTPPDAVLIDPFSNEVKQSNPAVIFAQRRVAIPNPYDLVWRYTTEEVDRRRASWSVWTASGFTDEAKSREIALVADAILTPQAVSGKHWALDVRIGSVFVYRSLLRTPPGQSVAATAN